MVKRMLLIVKTIFSTHHVVHYGPNQVRIHILPASRHIDILSKAHSFTVLIPLDQEPTGFISNFYLSNPEFHPGVEILNIID
jgi:hypothetical protein